MVSFNIVKDVFENCFELTTVSSVLLATVFALWFFLKKNSPNNLPPLVSGSLPILGHLHLLTENMHSKFCDWQEKYGPVYRIKFGKTNAVILGVYSDIKETYKMKGMTNRDPEMFRVSSEFPTMLEMNGKEWIDRRRFTTKALRTTAREQPNENIIQEEIFELLKILAKKDLSKIIDIRKPLSIATNNVIFNLICGKRYNENDPILEINDRFKDDFQTYLQIIILTGNIGIPKYVLKLCSAKFRAGLKALKDMDQFFKNEISAHENELKSENGSDFIHLSLLEIPKSKDSINPQTRNHIRGDALILLQAGTETVCITLEWIIMYAAKYQNFQDKIHQEIVNEIGDRNPIWNDRNRMPYTEAFLLECQRMATVMSVNLARCTPCDIKIRGYDVPKGTLVIANFLAVHMDPKLWINPEEFNPTRFLSNDGKNALVPEFFVSFSIGSRNCLGDQLAKMELFLIITALIQKYKILPPNEGVSLESSYRVAHQLIKTEIRLESRGMTN